MAEAIAERVKRYILDGGDEDLRRLLGVAESTREMARSAFRRVGMQEGWHVIDCGCGPIGGLAYELGAAPGEKIRSATTSSSWYSPVGRKPRRQ